MADNDQNSAQEKTEQPTQRKLDKAREDGKTVISKEMYVCTSIIMMLVFMYFFAFNYKELIASWKSIFFLIEGVK